MNNNKAAKILLHSSTWYAPWLVPILMYFVSTDRELRSLSLQAILFQIIICPLLYISFFLSFAIIGIPFLILFGILWLITPIVGIVYAIKDKPFRYPIVSSFVR